MKKYFYILLLSSLSLSAISLAAPANPAGPTLTIRSGALTKVFTREDLLKSKALKKLTVDDKAQNKGVSYSVVPITTLFEGVPVPPGATIQFTALDGFSGIIKSDRLLDLAPGHSHAYVAFDLPERAKNLGPYYIVWENPIASHISTEEWPYALALLEVKTGAEVSYTHLQPDLHLAKDDPIRKGQDVFIKNCFSCHTLNKEGSSHVGPDLNIPYSPIEYFKDDFFEKYVRSIQAVHYFPEAKMNAFSKETISDAEFKNLKAYLTHMSKRKLR